MDELIRLDHNLPKVQKVLLEIARRSGSMRPALKVMGRTLVLSTEQRFDKQVDPTGAKWKDLKRATWKKKKNNKILTESTNLRDGIEDQVTDDTLLVGSDSPYGAIHQLGGTIEQKGMTLHMKGRRFAKKGNHDRTKTVDRTIKMPDRPFLGISKQDEADLLDDAGQYLLG